jgi:CRP-like cAMP-binding protein
MEVEIKNFFNVEQIAKEKTDANHFFLIKVGNVVLLQENKAVTKLGPGDMFGIEYALHKEKFPYSALSHGTSSVVQFDRSLLIEKLNNTTPNVRAMVEMVLNLSRKVS